MGALASGYLLASDTCVREWPEKCFPAAKFLLDMRQPDMLLATDGDSCASVAQYIKHVSCDAVLMTWACKRMA